jgi:hypothetical protein
VSAGQILSRDYSLVAADLRQLASLEASLALAGFDPTCVPCRSTLSVKLV